MKYGRVGEAKDATDEVVGFFVDVVRSFGAPRSLGAIYGLLFVSHDPVTFEEIVAKLKISTGSVSQGLRLLRAMGLVDVSCTPGERRDRFVAETQLRQVFLGLYRHTLEQQIRKTDERFDRMLVTLQRQELTRCNTFWSDRLALLEQWRQQFYRAKHLLEFIIRNEGQTNSWEESTRVSDH